MTTHKDFRYFFVLTDTVCAFTFTTFGVLPGFFMVRVVAFTGVFFDVGIRTSFNYLTTNE